MLTLVKLDLLCSVIRKPPVRIESLANPIQTMNLVIDCQSIRDIARIEKCIY
jgi:hypothetical protein